MHTENNVDWPLPETQQDSAGVRKVRRFEQMKRSMRNRWRGGLLAAVLGSALLPLAARTAQHDHPAPEKLGSVDFLVSCEAAARSQFNRSVALLHSFASAKSE